MEIAILALGCFWGPEIKFNKFNGVINTEVGYCGGNIKKTNYEEQYHTKIKHSKIKP